MIDSQPVEKRPEFYIQTHSGILFDLLNPTSAMVNSTDLVEHLVKIARWGGATKNVWTVLHHSLLVAKISQFLAWRRELGQEVGRVLVLVGALHDGHEYVTGDMTRPVQRVLEHLRPGFKSAWDGMTSAIQVAIYGAFGLIDMDLVCPIMPLVREADDIVLLAESLSPVISNPGRVLHGKDTDLTPGEAHEHALFLIQQLAWAPHHELKQEFRALLESYRF